MNPTHIRVFNSNDFVIDDRYDGVLYEFKSDDKDGRLVPVTAAALFFGFPVDENGDVIVGEGEVHPNWEHVQRRWGWNTVVRRKDEEMHDAVTRTNSTTKDWCSHIRMEAVTMALREVSVRNDELPEPRDPLPEQESETIQSALMAVEGEKPRRGRPRKQMGVGA